MIVPRRFWTRVRVLAGVDTASVDQREVGVAFGEVASVGFPGEIGRRVIDRRDITARADQREVGVAFGETASVGSTGDFGRLVSTDSLDFVDADVAPKEVVGLIGFGVN